MEALQYLKEKYEKEGNAIYFREPDLPMSTSLERICKYMQEYAESHTAAHTAKLRERVKELEATLSINRYTIEDMRKSFYAGHSLCDDEWRDKTKLTGFDEFIDSLK